LRMKNSTLLKKTMLLITMVLVGFSYGSAAIMTDTSTILSEPFANTLGNFTQQSLIGSQVWTANSTYVKISGYVSSKNYSNDTWLISPVIDLSNSASINLSFTHVHRYGVNYDKNLQVLVTDAYSSGPIDTTKWTAYPFTMASGSSWTFVNSGKISLDAFAGKRNVRIAFRYKSDSTQSAATWEIKNVELTGFVREVVLSENFDKMTSGTLVSPSSTAITSIDTYMQTTGWSAVNAFPAGGSVKLGGSSSLGSLTTPSLDLSQDGGKFYASFYSARWSTTDSSYFNILVNGVQTKTIEVLNDRNSGLSWYGPIELTGGAASTTIQFAGANTKNSRFFLDSLIVTQQRVAIPSATLPTVLFKTKAGVTQTQNLTLTGKNLSGDLTVALANTTGTAFSTTVTTVTKVNALAGFAIPVVYTPTAIGVDTATITISGGGLAENLIVKVAGSAFVPVSVADLAALRAAYVADQSATIIYEITGELTVTFVQSSGNSKYVQDATGGLLIYDTQGKITTTFAAGYGMTGLMGTLTEYGKVLEIVPVLDASVSSTTKPVVPVELTIPQAKTDKERYESMLVLFKGLSKSSTTTATTWGTAKTNFNFVNGTDTIVLRTNYTGLDYMTASTNIPTVATDYAGVLLEYNGTLQFCPRSSSDIGYVNALTEIQVNEAFVCGANGVLNVKASQGQLIEVYSLIGVRVVRSIAEEGINTFNLGKDQLYLVKVGNTTAKIVL
jgi:hypothetical protein